WQRRDEIGSPRRTLLIMSPFFGWVGLSVFWSIDPDRSQSTLLSLLVLAGVAQLLFWQSRLSRREEADRILYGLSAGMLVALLVMVFEVLSAYQLTRLARGLAWDDIINIGFGGLNVAAYLKNGVVIAALTIWPVVAWLWLRRWRFAAIVMLLLLTSVIFGTGHSTALLALAGGFVCGAAGLLLPKTLPTLLIVLSAGWLMLAPVVLQPLVDHIDLSAESGNTRTLPPSMIGRLVIWDFVLEKIAERPLSGWGLGVSRSVPGGDEKVDVTYFSAGGDELILFTDFRLPLHPHNQVLQIWLELGGVGAVCLALSFILLVWRAAGRVRSQILSGADCAGLTTAMVFANSSFGLWQNWWIGLLALTMLWHGLLRPADPESGPPT
ncbi:MAG: O-antigen ligase family protein, partial [Rhodospirillales bacterium]